jgi:hypothetical protein
VQGLRRPGDLFRLGDGQTVPLQRAGDLLSHGPGSLAVNLHGHAPARRHARPRGDGDGGGDEDD